MNILHISSYVPSFKANHAGGVMMAKEVETLSQKHNVYEMGFINDEQDQKYSKAFDPNKSTFIKSTTFVKMFNALTHLYMPTLFAIRNSRAFKKALIQNIQKWHIDAIHADYTAMGQFYWLKKKFPSLKFNLYQHDVVYQSYQRKKPSLYNRLQQKLVKKYEGRYCHNADVVFVASEKDKKLMKKFYGLSKNVYALNPYYGIEQFGQQGNPKIKHSICFIGKMNRFENEDAAMRLVKIFNEINKKNDYKLYIIGASPSKRIQSLANKHIIITGFVDDLEKTIDQCQIAVFPLRYGAGIKFKVLQAFSLGLPVITTAVGAEGIDEDGKALILAEDDEEIKKNIIKLLNDQKFYKRKINDCTKWAKQHFNWEKSREIFTKVYNSK